MLENLNSVYWSKLKHAYGQASDVPRQIRALTSRDEETRYEALWELYGNIFHQGTRYQATPHAVPFLYELICNPKIKDREQIIHLLVNIALGYPEYYLPEGFNPKEFRIKIGKAQSEMSLQERSNNEKYGYGPHVDIACYEAVLKGIPNLIKLLNDQDVNIRQAATYALAWFPEFANTSAPKLRRLLRVETDQLSIANVILSIGLLIRQSAHAGDFRELETYLSYHQPLLLRTVASIAQAVDPLKEEIVTILIDAIKNADLLQSGNQLKFNDGNLAGYAGLVLSHNGKKVRARVIPALCETLKLVNAYQALDVTQALLNLVVSNQNVSIKETPAASLDSLQVKALNAIADYGGWEIDGGEFINYFQLVRMYGLPESRAALKQYLASY